MESYTAKPNEVEEEAEGMERKHGGRTHRANGGVAARARGGRSPEHETKTEEEHEEEKKKREEDAAEWNALNNDEDRGMEPQQER